MKKKIRIETEVDVPDCLDEKFLKYISMLDKEAFLHIYGFAMGALYANGKISEEELMEYTEKYAKKD